MGSSKKIMVLKIDVLFDFNNETLRFLLAQWFEMTIFVYETCAFHLIDHKKLYPYHQF